LIINLSFYFFLYIIYKEKMHAITAIYGAVLLVLLTPGLLLRIPSKGPLLTASIVHAIVFAILFYLISKLVYQYSSNRESFKSLPKKPTISLPPNSYSDYIYGGDTSKKVVWTGNPRPATDNPCWQINTKDSLKINGTDAKIVVDSRKYAHCNYPNGPDVRLSNQLF
jgi:hypothetical protein